MKRRALLQTAATLATVPAVATTALASSGKPQHLRAYLYPDDLQRLKRREPQAVERVLTTVVDGVSAWEKVTFVAGRGPGPHAKEAQANRHKGQPLNIVFDGPPGPVSGRFVEVETDDGRGVHAGTWHKRPDGCWVLRITELPVTNYTIPEARRALIQAFKDDPDFRETYVANIACCLMDDQASQDVLGADMQDYDTRMAYAERIMGHLFNPRELGVPTG